MSTDHIAISPQYGELGSKVLVERAALNALLQSVMPVYEGSTQVLQQELRLDELVPEAVTVTRRKGRGKRGEKNIDPMDQLVSIVLGVPELMNRRLQNEVDAAGSDMQAYLRAVLHLAMRTGLMERVTAEMIAQQRDTTST